jgi:tetratricopeptide (TPR) repeat protein
MTLGDLDEAQAAYERALEAAEGMPIAPSNARIGALQGLSHVAGLRGDLEASARYIEDAIELARQRGADSALGYMLMSRGNQQFRAEVYADARESYAEAATVFEANGDIRMTAYVLSNSAAADWELGDFELALEKRLEALRHFRTVHDRRGIGTTCVAVAEQTFHVGAVDRECLEEAVVTLYEIGDRVSLAGAIELVAAVAVEDGNAADGLRLLGVTDALGEGTGAQLDHNTRGARAASETRARDVIDPDDAEKFYAEGHGLSDADAMALATSVVRR